jgi:hypothetical protein
VTEDQAAQQLALLSSIVTHLDHLSTTVAYLYCLAGLTFSLVVALLICAWLQVNVFGLVAQFFPGPHRASG